MHITHVTQGVRPYRYLKHTGYEQGKEPGDLGVFLDMMRI